MSYLELGADPRICNGQGRNALHLCSQTGMISLFVYILDNFKLDISSFDAGLLTPLHIAISERREEMALLIISLSPKMSMDNDIGKSALELAVDLGSYRITRHLLLNKVNRQADAQSLIDIQKKCEDKDIHKLLVNLM